MIEMESVLVVGSSKDEGIGNEGISDEDEDMMGYEDKREKGPSTRVGAS